ncbi:MAG: lactonase family protein [Tannerellaceae bacterium]|jgi:6-phosphogluconolactonase (cycloisomerase 2 family)|nr:lactonase family protein [Tannerellaceae bacterium]
MHNLIYLLIGTYTLQLSEGVYVYSFDPVTGESAYAGMAPVENPSYLAASLARTFIYTVTENDGASYANALSFDGGSGALRLLNSEETKGDAPCHLAVDRYNSHVVTANYGGGSISVFPLQADGRLKPVAQVIAFEGKGADPERQGSPHLHCVQFSPCGRYLFAADLGRDYLYRFETDYSGSGDFIDERSLTAYKMEEGSGPRHFAFHPSGNYLYLINELSGTVTAFTCGGGQLAPFQTVVADTLHAKGSAAIGMTPDGRFLYASNRLQGDGIAIFAIAPSNGMLTKVGYQPTGRHPRHFTISPDGKFLLSASRDQHVVEVFEIDRHTGLLRNIHKDIHIDMPVCLEFIDPARPPL